MRSRGRIGSKLLFQSKTVRQPVHKRVIKVQQQAGLSEQPEQKIVVSDMSNFVSDHAATFSRRPLTPLRWKKYQRPPPANRRCGNQFARFTKDDRLDAAKLRAQHIKQFQDRSVIDRSAAQPMSSDRQQPQHQSHNRNQSSGQKDDRDPAAPVESRCLLNRLDSHRSFLKSNPELPERLSRVPTPHFRVRRGQSRRIHIDN